jgi:hypothetical protein
MESLSSRAAIRPRYRTIGSPVRLLGGLFCGERRRALTDLFEERPRTCWERHDPRRLAAQADEAVAF